MSYEALTLEEMRAEFVRLGAEFTTISNARQAILVEMEKRKAQARAKVDTSRMSEAEKDALRVELGLAPEAKP